MRRSSYIDMESHVVSAMHYSDQIATVTGKSNAVRLLLARGTLLHDIGKNDPLITWLYNSPDIWSRADRTVGQVHVWSGAARLRSLGVDNQIVRFAQLHHPNYTGLGRFGEIDELIQIMTAGDQLSAGLVKRTYAEPRTVNEVMRWLYGDMNAGYIKPEIYDAVERILK